MSQRIEYGVRFTDGDIDSLGFSESAARRDLSRFHAWAQDPNFEDVYAGAELVKRRVINETTDWEAADAPPAQEPEPAPKPRVSRKSVGAK